MSFACPSDLVLLVLRLWFTWMISFVFLFLLCFLCYKLVTMVCCQGTHQGEIEDQECPWTSGRSLLSHE